MKHELSKSSHIHNIHITSHIHIPVISKISPNIIPFYSQEMAIRRNLLVVSGPSQNFHPPPSSSSRLEGKTYQLGNKGRHSCCHIMYSYGKIAVFQCMKRICIQYYIYKYVSYHYHVKWNSHHVTPIHFISYQSKYHIVSCTIIFYHHIRKYTHVKYHLYS